jgi:ABC-type Fe3+ transport system permease subunit
MRARRWTFALVMCVCHMLVFAIAMAVYFLSPTYESGFYCDDRDINRKYRNAMWNSLIYCQL